jgi:hypothetical protein
MVMLALGVTAAGCGEPKPPAGALEQFIARVVRGEAPETVVREAGQYGDDFAVLVQRRAVAARQMAVDFGNGPMREPACLTLDAVNAMGGVDKTPEEKIIEFAREQTIPIDKARAFAKNLKQLSNLELTVVPSIYCAVYGVRQPVD